MEIIRVQNEVEGGRAALACLKEALTDGARVLGLATGSTPLAFYDEWVASDVDTSQLISVNLDEYVGLSADNPQSYAYFMKEHLFAQKPFKASYLPDGMASDLKAEVARYNQLLAEHPVDFQILGIGGNGHIGFNEPGTSFQSTTHVVELTEETIRANARFFDKEEDVPRQAISMGIHNILSAKRIVLMAYGKAKADAVAKMVKGPVTEAVPASVLQTHPNVTVIVDKAAAARL